MTGVGQAGRARSELRGSRRNFFSDYEFEETSGSEIDTNSSQDSKGQEAESHLPAQAKKVVRIITGMAAMKKRELSERQLTKFVTKEAEDPSKWRSLCWSSSLG